MTLFDGLYGYEIVMLVLGSVLFIALLTALVMLIARGRSFGKLLPFFALPIVMIGFPGLKSIEVSKDGLKLERVTRELLKNPTDKGLRDALRNQVASLSS